LLALSAAGCSVFGLSAEERQELAQHQERASIYWQANRLPQALEQVRKGLEIAPTDYKMNQIKGYCLLRQANDSRYATTPARRYGLLEDATAAFDATLALRPLDEHSPQLLLGDALLHEELARTELHEKQQAEQELARRELSAQERALVQVRLQEHDLLMRQHLARAERDLELLLRRGDLLQFAHKHMMNARALRGDYAGAVEHGQKFLERVNKAQTEKQKVYASTTRIDDEHRAAQELGGLVADELTVRTQLANLHYDHGHFDLAIGELDRILTMDPGRSIEYYNRARSLFEVGRHDEAYRDVQKFLATHQLPAGHSALVRAHDLLRQVEERRRR
jgi:tetratricopeptide (TPR) repeat protein